MQHFHYDTLTSTNACAMEALREDKILREDRICPQGENLQAVEHCPQGDFVVSCRWQSAGRGQVGNSWESAAGANALFSIVLRDLQLPASEHFAITQMCALGIVEALSMKNLRIKWPNDIYYGDGKLAGILIESLIFGPNIRDCVCGIGLNVHQEAFLSDAPNPVSIKQSEPNNPWLNENMATLIEKIASHIIALKNDFLQGKLSREELQQRYMEKLYRLQQWHRFQDEEGSFEARIVDVLRDGRLQIEKKADGCVKNYAFKELRFII